LNATGFVSNYFSFGGNTFSNNPYILGYKRIIKNSAFRVGVNYSLFNTNRQVNPQQPRSYNQGSRFDLRIGYEGRKFLSPKWVWFYGLDVTRLASQSSSKTTQKFGGGITGPVDVTNISSSSNISSGGGPITGLQWNISKRIAVLAEARAYLLYSENRSNTKWEDVPENIRIMNPTIFEERNNVDYITDFRIFLPLDVFVVFKF